MRRTRRSHEEARPLHPGGLQSVFSASRKSLQIAVASSLSSSYDNQSDYGDEHKETNLVHVSRACVSANGALKNEEKASAEREIVLLARRQQETLKEDSHLHIIGTRDNLSLAGVFRELRQTGRSGTGHCSDSYRRRYDGADDMMAPWTPCGMKPTANS